MDLLDLYDRLSKHDTNTFFRELQQIGNAIGFEYCAYGVRSVCHSSTPIVINNYHDGWNLAYTTGDYFSVDPVVKHGLRSTGAMMWNDRSFIDVPFFREEARSYGLENGISQSQRDGNTVGMLTLASAYRERDILACMPHFLLLSQLSHDFFLKHLAPAPAAYKLTEKETDILRWTADGKTSGDIATAMGISERTVNFHINNVLKKLGVHNRYSAVAKAMAHNILV